MQCEARIKWTEIQRYTRKYCLTLLLVTVVTFAVTRYPDFEMTAFSITGS